MLYELDRIGFIGPRAIHLETAYQLHQLSKLDDIGKCSRYAWYETNVVDAHDDMKRAMPKLKMQSLNANVPM